MSPAGYRPQLHAAIEAGADAVYFGLKHFTARAKVGLLGRTPEVMHTLHRRGVRATSHSTRWYSTTNSTRLPGDGADRRGRRRRGDRPGRGIVRMARRIAPDLEIHGSTQMSITSAEGVRLRASSA